VEWLLNSLPVDRRFNLVHCTHLDNDEVKRLGNSGANAVLCPGTEGNLGDGIFRLTDFAANNGSWSIGTDSHISLNPLEDLRWLDYAQRFTTHKRNTFDDGARMLVNTTVTAGRLAMGNPYRAFFELSQPFDAVVFNARSPLLAHGNLPHILSSIVYTAESADIYGTLVNGRWVVKDQHHINGKAIRSSFMATMRNLTF
jgi:formimidoylglutamate deiminase